MQCLLICQLEESYIELQVNGTFTRVSLKSVDRANKREDIRGANDIGNN
jgi:hypothetical protein